jgi:hypothetical protein
VLLGCLSISRKGLLGGRWTLGGSREGLNMPGRTPKPTKLLELTGAFRKNPKRKQAREGEPESVSIGGPPAKWMIFHPDIGYQRCEKLRAIWDNCTAMWPWIEFADRDALEDYCRWKMAMDDGTKLSGAEISAMKSIRSELGGTGSGRARLGVRSHRPPAAKQSKAADPRAAFLARKFG